MAGRRVEYDPTSWPGAPFTAAVQDCVIRLADRIIAVESKRDDIARTERSARDPKAQRLKDLLSRSSSA
jgi:hypothetical protein